MNIGLSRETESSAKNTGRNAVNTGRKGVKYARKAGAAAKTGAKAAGAATGPAGWAAAAVSVAVDAFNSPVIGSALKGLVITILSIIFLFIPILITNTANISFDTIMHLDEKLHPWKEIEETENDNIQNSIRQEDIKYATIIADAMRDEHDELEELIKYECERQGVDYEASKGNIVDNTIIPNIQRTTIGGGGEVIAATAERLSWPEGTPSSKWDWDEGGAPTEDFQQAVRTLVPEWQSNRCYKTACCCHSTRVIVGEAMGELPGNLLPNTGDPSAAKAELEDSLEGFDFEIFAWDGKEDSLQRGDVISYCRKSGGGHVWIYLGDGRHADGGRTNNWFNHISKDSDVNDNVDNYNYCYVMRYRGGSAGFSPENFVTQKVYIGEAKRGERALKNNSPGDQSGDEVTTSQGYGGGWTRAYRAKDPVTRLKLANAMQKACSNNRIGYDQNWPDRKSAYKAAEKVDFKIDSITANCETTNTELVALCMRSAGLSKEYSPADKKIGAQGLKYYIEKSGKFETISPSEANAEPGDILQTETRTAIVVSTPNIVNVPTNATNLSGNFGQGVEKWVKDTVAQNKYYYKDYTAKGGKLCPLCHPGSGDGWNCIGFAWASWRHGGGTPSACSCDVVNNSQADRVLNMSENEASKFITSLAGVPCKVIIDKSGIPESTLLPGDIYWYYSGSTYKHTAVYIGDGQYGHSGGGLVSTGTYSPHAKVGTVKVAIRYTGPNGGALTGSNTTYESYDTLTTVKTISKNDGRCVTVPTFSGWAAQSIAYHNGTIYLQETPGNRYAIGGHLLELNESGQLQKDSGFMNSVRHGQGLAYCTADSTLYSATTGSTGNNRVLNKFNPATLSQCGSINVGTGAAMVGYDRMKNQFVVSSLGTNLKTFDSGFSSEINSFPKMREIEERMSPQDVGAYNGIAYLCVYDRGVGNHVDMYNTENGDYLGTYEIPYDELEDVDVDNNGEIVLLMDSYRPYLQFTGIKVAEGNGAQMMNYDLAARSRDVMLVVSAFSVYEAQLLPTETDIDKYDEEDSGFGFMITTLLGSIRNKIRRDIELPATLRAVLKNAQRVRQDTHQTTLFEITIAEPEEIDGKMVSPLIEINPAGGEKLCKLFHMDPKGKYRTEVSESGEYFGSRKAGEDYLIGDTSIESAIETNTDTHLEILYDDLNGQVEKNKLVLPIKTLLTTLPLSKDFAADKKGIECMLDKKEKIYACERGEVEMVRKGDSKLGNYIVVSGYYRIVYAHLDTIDVKTGDMVSKNKILGTASKTFRLEVYEEGTAVDPEPLFIHREFGLFKGSSGNSFSPGVVAGRRTSAEGLETSKYFTYPNNPWPRSPAPPHGNCTWYAWGRFCEYHGRTNLPSFYGDAFNWWNTTSYEKGQTPRVGAIMVWDYGIGVDGHVGFVEEVKSNGDVEITESGWTAWLFHTRTLKKSENYDMHYKNAQFKGFIYPMK